MREISRISGRLRLAAFISSISLLLISAYSDDLSTPKNGTKEENHSGSKGSTVALICLLLVAVTILSFFLFKIWQKKKREEQYARLLKLFEEDDELELELGLRD
ncbi:hypothetical protein ABFS82_02G076100 [Erythranthe guttata]|uniref:Uncharacterized protein n=1 Tax=Erythranthe guttata TaxID=4155 RepID=A0A022R4U6_ERYGU|nr:PREDICTED: uncharacterized protein LOC105960581 [Erythranthe guttata]EYU34999.1 hypothetical protein MIMGU_mgv1a016875mg [Erythranthe guttata]|eukprot:XP_012840225.1 PREDICTED: uncharacterized protein LOC105960581 [Erythranthe guttata]